MAEHPAPEPAFQGAPGQPQKQRTYFFCCLGLVIALGIVGLAFAAVVGYAWHSARQTLREELSSAEPIEVAQAALPEAKQQDLYARLAAFHKAIQGGEGSRELALTEQEVNYLLQHQAPFKKLGKLHATLQEGTVQLEASIALGEFPGASLFGLDGRYLNGTAKLKLDMQGSRPGIYITEFSRADGEIPEPVLQQIRTINLADIVAQEPELRAAMNALEDIEITGNALRLRLPEAGNGAGEQ